MSPPRFPWEIEQELSKVSEALKVTPSGSPDVGHLATIMIGLSGELRDSQRAWEPVSQFPLPPLPRWMVGGK